MEKGKPPQTASPAHESARERILRAAAHLYAVRGFEATSMRDIAELAGVTKPLIFYHFESKERLCTTLLREATDSCRTAGCQILGESMSATDRLRAFIRHHVRVIRERPEIFAFAHKVLTSPANLPIGFDYRAEGRVLFEQVLQVIDEGRMRGEFRDIDSVPAAVFPLAALGMYVGAFLTGQIEEIPEGLEDLLLDILLNGIKEQSA